MKFCVIGLGTADQLPNTFWKRCRCKWPWYVQKLTPAKVITAFSPVYDLLFICG